MGRPSRSDAVDNRAAIVEAALRLFAQHGYDGVPLRDIAAAARIHTSTIYYYFPEKSQLYDMVLADALEFMSELFTSSLEKSGAPGVGIRLFFERILALWDSHAPQAMVIDRALLGQGEIERLLPRAVFGRAQSSITATIRSLVGEDVDEKTVADILEVVFGACYGVAKLRPLNKVVMRDRGELSTSHALAEVMSLWFTDGLRSISSGFSKIDR